MPDAFPCPTCGEEVPSQSTFCPHCGACDTHGWNEEATRLDGLDLPDNDFGNEHMKCQFEPLVKPRSISWLWWMVGVIVTLAFLCVIFSNL